MRIAKWNSHKTLLAKIGVRERAPHLFFQFRLNILHNYQILDSFAFFDFFGLLFLICDKSVEIWAYDDYRGREKDKSRNDKVCRCAYRRCGSVRELVRVDCGGSVHKGNVKGLPGF